MKVMLLCAAFPPYGKGGGPISSQMIARSLAEYNDVVVITVSDDYEQWSDGAVRVKSIGSPNIYWNYWTRHSTMARVIWHLLENFNPRAFFRIRREIRLEQPDVVATISIENINVASWFTAYLSGVPIVHFLQSHYLLCWRGSMFLHRHNCVTQCFSCKVATSGRRFFSAYVDAVTAEAEPTLTLHLKNGYFKKATSFVAPAMLGNSTDFIHREDRMGSPLIVGFLGRLTYSKGVHIIARAAKMLVRRDQFEIVIAGDGDSTYREELGAEFEGCPVSFKGWIASREFFETIDVLVVPSLWREPFGRVCIEAFAAGVPVLASNIGGMPTIVKDKRNGFLFGPGDSQHLATILNTLIEDRDQLRALRANCLADAELYRTDRVGQTIQRQLELLKAHRRRCS